jgi:hypothetical protein
MAAVMVTVGGSETEGGPGSPTPPGRRGPLYVVLGLAAGLILGVLFNGATSGRDPTSDTVVESPAAAPATSLPLTTTTTEVVPSRLATMAPGVLDTLVVSAVDRNSMSVVTTWRPSDRIPTVQTLPWGDLVADATGTWIATAGPTRYTTESTLWVGNAAYMEPVSTRLLAGPVWHRRLPGLLAWVEESTDGPVLMRAEFVAGRRIVPVRVSAVPSGVLVAWNDAGFVVADADGLALWDEAGTVIATAGGQPIGASRSYVATTGQKPEQVLLTSTLEPVGPAPWEADCTRVTFSPIGVSALVWCGSGDSQRVEYWGDPANLRGIPADQQAPLFVNEGEEYVDLGFTSNGIPFFAYIDPIRPTSAIIFHHPADGSFHVVYYPGRIQHMTSVVG